MCPLVRLRTYILYLFYGSTWGAARTHEKGYAASHSGCSPDAPLAVDSKRLPILHSGCQVNHLRSHQAPL